jgi:hypothetical protein
MPVTRLYSAVCEDVHQHCVGKGYQEGSGVNNFTPHNAVAAFGMAKLLAGKFDQYVAVAPEGHIYGYFFERLGVPLISVHTDYPPTTCKTESDLSLLTNQRVLVIEDDVISGRTLQIVVDLLQTFRPTSLSLYLGHNIGIQHLENVPEVIGRDSVYIAERSLDQMEWKNLDAEFEAFF